MSYSVKEIYYTLQGEGANTGRCAVFCRFSGCNLWSGVEQDRPNAICTFCDTNFLGTDGPGGGSFSTAKDLARTIAEHWPTEKTSANQAPLVVFTGGEPALQLDDQLVQAVHGRNFEIAIETNGTRKLADGIDWVCVSPKGGASLVVGTGDELKLVFPQINAPPEMFEHLDFRHFFLQPMDGPEVHANTKLAIEYCKAHPQWRLSIQMHKAVGIP